MDNGTFQIEFNNQTNFSGNLFKREWGKINDLLNIKKIIFKFGNKLVKMEGFSEYNLTYETHMVFGGKGKVANVTLVGRGRNNSVLIIFDCNTGKILKKQVAKYSEYQWISSTWKKGIVGGLEKAYYG